MEKKPTQKQELRKKVLDYLESGKGDGIHLMNVPESNYFYWFEAFGDNFRGGYCDEFRAKELKRDPACVGVINLHTKKLVW